MPFEAKGSLKKFRNEEDPDAIHDGERMDE
jgi:hypothetical protein